MSLAIPQKELEPEQAAAVREISKHIAVTAGPGSGKTTVLVERYLHILRERKPSIDQIVALTFTNRAANEMRERLRTRLNQLQQTTSDKDRRRWLDYKRRLDGAVITTIHGFCARLLREYPVEAQIDPQFVLLDEHRAAMLLESVVEATLSEFISSGHDEISRLTLGVGRGKLATALAQIYRGTRGQGISFAELALKTAISHASENDHARAVEETAQAMNDFLSVRRTTRSQLINKEHVLSSWLTWRQLLESIPRAENLAEYCRAVESFRSVRPKAAGPVTSAVKRFDELLWEKDLSGRVPQICLDLFARQYALEMINLLSRIDERLDQEKQKISALDFDDLELRAIRLLDRPEVLSRSAERYKFFLVDEFQDTNGLQKRLLERLALSQERLERANLFIVGDRKQSIYGFRGADVDVFREMTGTLVEIGGESKALPLNYRSQPPLINFFNYLFPRLFHPSDEIPGNQLDELGYIEHERSEAKRDIQDPAPLVELMISTTAIVNEDDNSKIEQTSRELDAEQLARRISLLVNSQETAHKFSDIAMLFRAMSDVQTYESAFRRAAIPYQTVLGRGFYEREEVTDLIQLLRFLDNKTDELALAAVLRSPFCGISDNALLALRCAPSLAHLEQEERLRRFSHTRKLLSALRHHREIAFITDDEHQLLDLAGKLLKELIVRRHHYTIGDLLRFAVERSEYLTVIAATFDGPQKLANVRRLFMLAERFAQSGSHLIRDFVRYVEDFEAIGGRESEGQIDEASNAVRLMTIHQAKGLEFPVVIIPDLQRSAKPLDNWVLLDRRYGLTLKVPDGRGKQVAGCTFSKFAKRQSWREQFESMRLLYVAATRARDRLILSGTSTGLDKLEGKRDSWLKWIWQSLELEAQNQSGVITLADDTQLQLTLNLVGAALRGRPCSELSGRTPTRGGHGVPPRQIRAERSDNQSAISGESLEDIFPLLQPIDVMREQTHRFSVTQLINYQRCPRQYYFDRVLHVPSADQLAVWNDAEAPEPPANLTATLKGAVIHKFCETFNDGDDLKAVVRSSLNEIVRQRRPQIADKLIEIDRETAVKELLPLAENYVSSDLYKRIEVARQNHSDTTVPLGQPGLWSELSFRIRRPLAILNGTIDKLLVTAKPASDELLIEIIDFKTNRISVSQSGIQAAFPAAVHARREDQFIQDGPTTGSRGQQMALDFVHSSIEDERPRMSVADAVALQARDYQLQMQAYASAVRTLFPHSNKHRTSLKVTLHFLEPNVEYHLSDLVLQEEACNSAIDEAIYQIISSVGPEHFPVKPAQHCRMCTFVGICNDGREWLARQTKLN